jgi:hypothetical protein
MGGVMTENKLEGVQTILKDLGDIDFVSFFRDFCYILGCQTKIGFGDKGTIGDLVVKQTLPFPQTVVVLDRRGASLTESEVQDYIEERPNDANLLIITHARPTDAVLSLGDKDKISIIGTRDIAHAIIEMDAVNLLATRIQEDGDLLEKHAVTLEELEYGPFHEHSSASDDGYPFVSNPFFDLKLLGYDFIESQTLSSSGMLVAMEIQSKRDDIKLDPESFTFYDANKYTYSGVPAGSRNQHEKFCGLLEEALSLEWNTSDYRSLSVSGGGRNKFILYFPCESVKTLNKVRYRIERLSRLFNISEAKIEDHYDVTIGSGPNSDYVSWEEFSCEITIEGKQRDLFRELPEDVTNALNSLQEE